MTECVCARDNYDEDRYVECPGNNVDLPSFGCTHVTRHKILCDECVRSSKALAKREEKKRIICSRAVLTSSSTSTKRTTSSLNMQKHKVKNELTWMDWMSMWTKPVTTNTHGDIQRNILVDKWQFLCSACRSSNGDCDTQHTHTDSMQLIQLELQPHYARLTKHSNFDVSVLQVFSLGLASLRMKSKVLHNNWLLSQRQRQRRSDTYTHILTASHVLCAVSLSTLSRELFS